MNKITRFTTLVVALLVTSNTSFAESLNDQSSSNAISVGVVDEIELSGSCTNGTDTEEREYVIAFIGVGKDEQVRIINKGSNGRNWKYRLTELSAKKTKLPNMTLSGGINGERLNHGLWFERVKTGERHQLNRLLGSRKCNSKGLVSVKFSNLWISLTESK